jgi:hypothetical protein
MCSRLAPCFYGFTGSTGILKENSRASLLAYVLLRWAVTKATKGFVTAQKI